MPAARAGKKDMDSKIERPIVAIVDDDDAVRAGLERVLRSNGMDASVFASSSAFIDTLEAQPSYTPACVILDVRMPDPDGLEVQKMLAAKRPGIPAVFITADSSQLKRARATGAAAVLEKPVDAGVLIAILRWILKSAEESSN
jgi:FixJ family two-component response regulator